MSKIRETIQYKIFYYGVAIIGLLIFVGIFVLSVWYEWIKFKFFMGW